MARTITERRDVIPLLAETFRVHGFDGASLSIISKATGLGKGSLYHFFPGGKDDMAEAVLDEIEGWFRQHVFVPLRSSEHPQAALRTMFLAVDQYFDGGGRICVVGVFALGDVRDRFAAAVHRYFKEWIDTLACTLCKLGHAKTTARGLAEDAVGGIQGALVLARALNDPKAFRRTLARLRERLEAVA